jgi:SanA protein
LISAASISIILCINIRIIRYSAGYILNNIDDLPDQYAAIVPGAAVYSHDRVSHIFYDRLLGAEALLKKGKVKKIIISGDHGQNNYDEVNTGLVFLSKHGINRSIVFTDHAGFDTYDTLYRAKHVFKADKVIIVTQKFHCARSVYIARKLGLDAYGYECDRRRYRKARYYSFRESIARVKAYLNVTFKSKPRFTGKPVPVTGDASKSRG